MQTQTILIAADHAGFDLKDHLKHYLTGRGYQVEDCGASEKNPDDDYPEILIPVALRISEKPTKLKAIVIGGSGQGEAIICNRFPEVRAAVFYGSGNDEELLSQIITLSREHNDANILSLGARFITKEQAEKAVTLWLDTAFSEDERHVRRLDQIENIA